MKKIIPLLLTLLPLSTIAQNVGIGTATPGEKLDVNGNINVTGTIKASGIDGNSGQVLMKNGSGNLVWGDMKEFKNLATFRLGSGNWIVPAGVTKVWVEVWGAGGGGNFYAGGGGGSYISGLVEVTPGNSVTYSVGVGGSGNTENANNGIASSVSYAAIALIAGGGQGATYTVGPPGVMTNGFGGQYNATPATFLNFYGERGGHGLVSQNNFTQTATTVFELVNGGVGGDAGNSMGTGGKSNTAYYNITASTLIRYSNALGNPSGPGGGGGSGLRFLVGALALAGSTGADGLVIIHY